MAAFLAEPKPVPPLDVPPSSATVTVRVIDRWVRFISPLRPE